MARGSFRTLNPEVLIRAVVLFGFASFFAVIILNGSVQLYVHPRIVPYMVFGIVAMTAIAIYSLKDLFRPARKYRVAAYAFFIVPLFLAFAVPAKAMDSTSMSFNRANIAQPLPVSSVSGGNTAQDARDIASDENNADDMADDTASSTAEAWPDQGQTDTPAVTAAPAQTDGPPAATQRADGPIIMGDDNFVAVLEEIYAKMDEYKGKEIQVIGFVFKDEKQFGDDEFVAARMMMTCCTADLQPVGFLCRYDETAGLTHDTWIKVSGTIDIVDYQGERMPCILVGSVSNAEKPKEEYVYPY